MEYVAQDIFRAAVIVILGWDAECFSFFGKMINTAVERYCFGAGAFGDLKRKTPCKCKTASGGDAVCRKGEYSMKRNFKWLLLSVFMIKYR